MVARYAGGHNAGHTVIIRRPEIHPAIGSLRCPASRLPGSHRQWRRPRSVAFLKEVGKLRELGIDVDAPVVHLEPRSGDSAVPSHDRARAESAPGRQKIGTTSRGIGPAYEDKMASQRSSGDRHAQPPYCSGRISKMPVMKKTRSPTRFSALIRSIPTKCTRSTPRVATADRAVRHRHRGAA